ncbi:MULTISPECIES: efflux RND transporter permease subunit [unclassified Arsukibacterium]|mgnify:FL=1|uniref:efflux RND transporter permease subunit n=1 Tax=unclassified Arsukibacterium TaxID=2635278 RepID=UPI000C64AA92|nr:MULTISPECIES: efflux RND transporter permease subunit [unclassified Arsukibacterium]MAA93346.1 multidrug efflux protein [Rheinheimera sp.]MBM35288.1 multidrug efflux protein [Rheinheimera sp.]|tara:strand:+ start:51662 stop:54748 length:3087 start_codon:yes stop_codon:yes gene_type:complete
MRFTDVFIKKPILASVVSLFIILLGLRAIMDMNVRQFPEIQNAVVTVNTVYVGADADLIQGFITTPLEREIASAEGIDYLVSTSVAGSSTVEAYLRLDYEPNEALTQIAAQVNKVRSELPENARDPVISLKVGQDTAAMYLSFYSEVLGNNQITDYIVRVIEPQLATIPGVQRAEILGARTFAMRIWLDSAKMAAFGITGSDISNALRSNNVLAALGRTKGQMVAVDLNAATDLRSAEQFADLVISADSNALVRLKDVATVELGAESYNSSVSFNGLAATFIGIEISPDANALDVIAEVRKVWDRDIIPQLPEGLDADIPYDSTEYIENAIDEVVISIVLALVIVILVIYAFLGSMRSVIIPAVAIPVSLIGTFFLMWLLGFTINLLTLLAMVLAIGIVVDDAIIMLENIHRHIEEGKSRAEAAILGARELAWPIITMSTTLVAVFLPIGFVGGLTGVLFVEFAFTLAASVILSGIVALTLSPVMCAYILKPHDNNNPNDNSLEHWLDQRFETLRSGYQRQLHSTLNYLPVVLTFGAIVLVSCYFLFITSPAELEPPEDQGFVFSILEADSFATLDYLEKNTSELNKLGTVAPEIKNIFIINGTGSTNNAIAGFVLAPWDKRERTTAQVLEQNIQPFMADLPGINSFALIPPSLPSPGGGTPVEFIVGSTQPFAALESVVQQILGKAMASGRFIFVDSDLKINRPRQTVEVDREKAALMGVSMQQIAADLGSLMSGADAGRFALDNRSYRVIPQVARNERLNPEQLKDFYTRNRDGELVPLSALVTLTESVQPQALRGFQQLNAVKISGVPRPGVPLGDALAVLDQIAAEEMPAGFSVDYAGQSRQFKAEGQQLVVTFFFALVVIFLILAAQFESFKNAIIILVTVPMSVCGALIFTSLGATSINIYTQVGLLTLVGLIAKHGILIVEFANQLQLEGRSKREAIEEATSIRLRPILMTTAATVLAMIPLLIATGAGAGSRYAMGLVIASGMTIGTLFTLYVVPAMYLLLARDYQQQPEAVSEASSALG